MTVTRVEVDPDSIIGEVGAMSASELDLLPFGAIRLDPAGTILNYNRSEERISGRAAKDVVGRNFFQEIAPCTRVRRFFGAFQTGVERRDLNEVFDFTFRFPAAVREVRIRMIYSATPTPGVWIFVTPIGS